VSAFFGALVLVLGAGSALYFVAKHLYAPTHPTSSHSPKTSVAPTPSPTPTLGPYGHIGSRSADPKPLTIAQLYPPSFKAGASFTRTASKLSRDCIDAVVGANLQSAVNSAGCSQSARATYVATPVKIMGTIGVLNLRSAAAATKAARAAGANDFVAQLKGRKGPTKQIGRGTGIEEAAAKGHYLILIWAEFTNLQRPKGSVQRASLERFMTRLLQDTANVSLANRMANGTPS